MALAPIQQTVTPIAEDSMSAKISFNDWLALKGYQTREDDERGLVVSDPDGGRVDEVGLAELDRDWFTSPEAHNPDVWGSEQAYWGGRFNIGSTESGNELGESGVGGFTAANGRQYIRTGSRENSRFYPFMRRPDDIVYDPRWGWGVDPEVAAAYGKAKDNSAQYFMTALSMVGAPMMAAMGGGGMLNSFLPDNPIVSGAIKGGVQGGISSLVSGGNPIEGVLRGGLTGGAGGGVDMLTSTGGFDPILSGAIKGGASGMLSSAMGGGNPLEGLVRGGVMGGGGAALNQGMNALVGPGSEGPVQVASGPSETMSDAPAPSAQQLIRNLAGTGLVEDYGLSAAPAQQLIQNLAGSGLVEDYGLSADMVPNAGIVQALQGTGIAEDYGVSPSVVPGYDVMTNLAGTGLVEDYGLSPELIDAGWAMSGVTPGQATDEEADEEQQAAAPAEKTNYAGVVKSIYSAYQSLTGKDLPPVPEYSPPARREGQDEAEYHEELASSLSDYLGVTGVDLSPDALRDAGVTPGTPQYLEYILAQIDGIIESIVGVDVSVLLEGESTEDLQGAIRGKTDAEMQQLLRALHSRGALDSMSAAPRAVDPFTGLMQELGLADGEMVNPAIAAYQRGIAGFGEGLLDSVSGADARGKIGELLGRNPDLFNLQARRDARRMQELLYQMQDDDERKRRGLGLEAAPGLGNDFWRDLLESRDTQLLDRMLRGVGSRERQGRAVEQLLGLGM